MSSPKLTRGRYSANNAVYVVTTIAHKRQRIFASSEIASVACGHIRRSDQEGRSKTHAWVIMPDHVHWMFTLPGGSMSVCVGRFKSHCARAVNRVRHDSGKVWQAGFYDHQLRDEDDMRAQADYIISNPVRAGIVTDIRDYPYWGCRWV